MNHQSSHLKTISYLVFCISIFICVDRVNAEIYLSEKNISPTTKKLQSDLLSRLVISQGKGTFTQSKYFKFLSEPIVSNGLFILQNQKALWQTQDPVFSQLLLTPKVIYTRLEPQIPYQPLVENGPFSKILSELMTGQFNNEDWRNIASKNNNCVRLKPKTTMLKKIFAIVQVCFIDELTRQFTLTDSNNNDTRIEMRLTSFKIDEIDSVQLNPANIHTATP